MIATGFAGGPTGARVLEQLREESVLTDFTRIAAETRINLAVIDPTSGEQTEINERGPAVSPRGGRASSSSGSPTWPAGRRSASWPAACRRAPAMTSTRAWSRTCGARRCLVVLDAEGEAMLAGLRAGASVVTPNEREAEELVGQEFADRADLAQGLSSWSALVPAKRRSRRPDGCVAVVGEGSERRFLEVRTEPLDPVSTVGSGDAFVAGYVAARYERPAGG